MFGQSSSQRTRVPFGVCKRGAEWGVLLARELPGRMRGRLCCPGKGSPESSAVCMEHSEEAEAGGPSRESGQPSSKEGGLKRKPNGFA